MGGVRRRWPLLEKVDSLLDALGVGERLVFLIMGRPAAGDEEDSEKGQETAANKLDGLLPGCALEVTVQDRASNDDA
jgi:hypothetical protein